MPSSHCEHVLDRLEFSDRTSELHPLVGVSQRIVQATLHTADHLLSADRSAERHQTVGGGRLRCGTHIPRR